MKQFLSPLLMAHALLGSIGLHAQTTKDGTALAWNHELVVVPGTITVNEVAHPAHTISVFETDEKTLLDLWKTDYTPIAAAVTSRPWKATDVRLPQLAEAPLLVYAETSTDKKAKLVKLTLAFMQNDSTPLADNGEQEKVMRDLAVRLNKAVVQSQIDRYQADLDKVADKLGDSQSDVAKAQKNAGKAGDDLEKAKAKRAKLERESARLQGDIAGLEKRFGMSNDPKDLKKLTKAREQLARNEREQAKLMKQESKAQGAINKHQGSLEKHDERASEHAESKEDLQRIIAELKRKLDSIR